MKHILFPFMMFAGMIATNANAQKVDRTKYPDYDPEIRPDFSLLQPRLNSAVKTAGGSSATAALPDHVNNAQLKFFPPIINQDGGSCAPASRICYMLAYELNAFRNADGKRPENRYPSHFVWLHTYGNSGKDEFVTKIGVPNAPTYGGFTYSRQLGNQEAEANDFGWMQGYDKWYSAMFNRMEAAVHIPMHVGTPEGRLALKRWLYNHNGDPDFNGWGGIAGMGVASGGVWKKIPQSPANREAGVVGKEYVSRWGTTFDHAMTIVGYDDRIEFDLNGNGIIGELEADEKGAWIIANSWGDTWSNNGFIYCPYAYGGETFTETSENKFKFDQNYWNPEVYKVRKNYRPFRTIKVKMDYSRRSEICLNVGIAKNLNATSPEIIIPMEYFKYAGDGNYGNTQPAPEVPMLGRWADGKLHHEPMEFGYDLTDLSESFDHSSPLKYFFIIDTKDWAEGQGKVYDASIIDYEFTRAGIENPFNLKGKEVQIQNKGQKTILSTIVYGDCFYSPKNLSINASRLSWQQPFPSVHTVSGYRLYRNGVLLDEMDAQTREYELEQDQAAHYAVSAIYEQGEESAKTGIHTPIQKAAYNSVCDFKHSGFAIPNVFQNWYDEATIEYWIRPSSLRDWNQSAGPDWGNFLMHATAQGKFVASWSNDGNRCETGSSILKTDTWTHIAVVIKHNVMTIYANGRKAASITSDKYSGIGGWGNLRFHESDNKSDQHAKYDEIRI